MYLILENNFINLQRHSKMTDQRYKPQTILKSFTMINTMIRGEVD